MLLRLRYASLSELSLLAACRSPWSSGEFGTLLLCVEEGGERNVGPGLHKHVIAIPVRG